MTGVCHNAWLNVQVCCLTIKCRASHMLGEQSAWSYMPSVTFMLYCAQVEADDVIPPGSSSQPISLQSHSLALHSPQVTDTQGCTVFYMGAEI